MSVNERIKKLIEFEKIKPSQMASRLKISPTTLFNIVGGRLSKPGYDVIAAILREYPDLNARWLLLGTGTMFEEGILSDESKEILKEYPKEMSEKDKEYLEKEGINLHEMEKDIKRKLIFFKDSYDSTMEAIEKARATLDNGKAETK